MEREAKMARFGFSWADEVEKEEQWKKGDSDRKPNPFGSARPREVVLEEKGVDWKKLDRNLDYYKPSNARKNEKPKENIYSSAHSIALGSRYLDPNRLHSQNISPLVPPLRYQPKNMKRGFTDGWNPSHSIMNAEHIPARENTDSRGKRKSYSPHGEETQAIERRRVPVDLNSTRVNPEVVYECRREQYHYGAGTRLNKGNQKEQYYHNWHKIDDQWEHVYQMYNARRERSNAQSRQIGGRQKKKGNHE